MIATVLQTADVACTAKCTGTEMEVGDTFDLLGKALQNLCLKVSLDGNCEGTTAAASTIVG